jgi:hypothetical protein
VFSCSLLPLLDAEGGGACVVEDHDGVPVALVEGLCDAVYGACRRGLCGVVRVGLLEER